MLCFVLFQSKGGILSKACDYIKELRQSNLKLGEDITTLDRLRIDNQLLRQEVHQHVFYGLFRIRNTSLIHRVKLDFVTVSPAKNIQRVTKR